MNNTADTQEKKPLEFPAFDVLTLSAWAYVGILYFVVVVLDLVTKNAAYSSSLFFTYFTILCLLSLNRIFSVVKKADIFFLIMNLFLVYISVNYLYPEGREYVLSRLPYLFYQVIPFYYVGLFFRFDEDFAYKMYLVSIVGVLLNVVYIFVFLASGRVMVDDNMTMGYQILPYVLYVFWYYLWKRTSFSLYISIVGIIFVIGMGTRGPLLSVLLLPTLYYLLEPTFSKKKKKAAAIVFISIYMLIDWVSSNIGFLISIRDSLKSFGLSSRIVDSIFTDIAESSTNVRLRIYDEIWYYITQKPFSGYGIFGDEEMLGYQSHNIVLGLLFHFGFVLGSFFLFSCLYIFIKSIVRARSSIMFGLFIVVFSCAFVRVLVSGTYICGPFFLLIGLSANICRTKQSDSIKLSANSASPLLTT